MSADPFFKAVEARTREFTWSSAASEWERTLAVGNFRGGAAFGRDYYAVEIDRLRAEVAALRELAAECWAWADPEALPDRILELTDRAGELLAPEMNLCVFICGRCGHRDEGVAGLVVWDRVRAHETQCVNPEPPKRPTRMERGFAERLVAR